MTPDQLAEIRAILQRALDIIKLAEALPRAKAPTLRDLADDMLRRELVTPPRKRKTKAGAR